MEPAIQTIFDTSGTTPSILGATSIRPVAKRPSSQGQPATPKPRPKAGQDESSFVKLSAEDLEAGGCVADQPQRSAPQSTTASPKNVFPITHHASIPTPPMP